MTIKYFLGNLGNEEKISQQAIQLRNIVISDVAEIEKIKHFKEFVINQDILQPDTILIINKSLMTHYGSEHLGLGADDFTLKSNLFKQFIDIFPIISSFKFSYAECSFISGASVNEIYPILRAGMIDDNENANYPSADLFEFIQSSDFSFDFDILLLEKYY